jgi:hypothetical protein
MNIEIAMDTQVSKFLDIYDKENPQDKKLDVYGKKEQITNVFAKENDEQSAMNIKMSMDIQVKKFIDIYNEESPPDKKIDVYGKKEQIADVYDN